MDGLDAADAVLEAIQVQPSMASGAGDGWGWASDGVSYSAGELSGAAEEWSIPAAALSAHGEASDGDQESSPWATFSYVGRLGADGHAVMAGCHIECTGNDGWGSRFTLQFGAHALPTAVGTAADPHLRFHCRTEIGAGGILVCDATFLLDVNRYGDLEVVTYDFDSGDARVLTTPFFQLHYEQPPLE